MHEIKIKQIKKPHLKNYTLSFDKELNLIVKTPVYYSKENVNEVVEKHRDWIQKNFNILFEKQKEVVKHRKEIKEGEIFEILEEEYILKYKYIDRVRVTSYLEEKYLVCELPNSYRLKGDIEKVVKESLVKLFKKIATTYVYSKARDVSNTYKVRFSNISIKDQSTKWGSCSSKGNLNFNWRLIFTPYKVIDYVIVHEVCHLRKMNHSKEFWDLVKLNAKDYKVYRKWLKDNQDILKNLI